MPQDNQLRPSPGWATSGGHIGVGRLGHHHDPGRLLDQAAVTERIYRYGWAYDERNSDLLGDCFTASGIWEGRIMGIDPVGPFVGRDAIIDYLGAFWDEQQDQRRHMFTNVIIDALTEVEATAHAYLLLTASKEEQLTAVTAGPYRFTLTRDDDSWRISRLAGGWDAPF